MGCITTLCNVTVVTCELAHEYISAAVDGELDDVSEAELSNHLETCPECRDYQDDAFALRRALRMRMVVEEPAASSRELDIAGSLEGVSLLRWLLFVVGGTLVILNLPAIVSTEGTTTAHLSRHDGVFGCALGVAMLAVAIKPHRAIGLVPLTSTLALLMGIAAIADLAAGNADPLGEAIHVVEFAGLVCLWVISGGPSRWSDRRERLGSALAARRARRDRSRPQSSSTPETTALPR